MRVGTHAISGTSQRRLWTRLREHKGRTGGTHPGGGDHRGSVFRWHVGWALLNQGAYSGEIRQTWGERELGTGSRRDRVKDAEYLLERDVSDFIGNMPFLWVEVPDDPGPRSDRKVLETNCIALLSNRNRPTLDPCSPGWLGRASEEPKVRESGLWLHNHVDDDYDLAFLSVLAQYVVKMRRA